MVFQRLVRPAARTAGRTLSRMPKRNMGGHSHGVLSSHFHKATISNIHNIPPPPLSTPPSLTYRPLSSIRHQMHLSRFESCINRLHTLRIQARRYRFTRLSFLQVLGYRMPLPNRGKFTVQLLSSPLSPHLPISYPHHHPHHFFPYATFVLILSFYSYPHPWRPLVICSLLSGGTAVGTVMWLWIFVRCMPVLPFLTPH
jgi:hypothetical protein